MVDADGEFIGILTRDEAIQKAREAEVDLVEVVSKADPPVAKIIDYGKMLYALQKKERHAKKAGKANEMKGIRLTFRMDVGDLERQRRHTEGFLRENHPVRVQLVLRGREKAHKDLAFEKMRDFCKTFEEIAKIDQPPRFSGFQIVAILKPIGGKK